jgi:hypothetical protein
MKNILALSKVVFFYFFISFCLSVITSYGQEPVDKTITIESTLVNVPVIVSDSQGRYVSGLKEQDFTLYDNKVKQPIAFFDAAEEPLNIALLMDTSKSTKNVLEDIKDAAFTFISLLRAKDQVMIVTFDSEVNFLTKLTNDSYKLEKAIGFAQVGERVGTKLNDAVYESALKLKSASGRKAIILLTDGKDHGSQLGATELIDKVMESNILIYTIFYPTILPRAFDQRNPQNTPQNNPNWESSPFPIPRGRGQMGRFPRFPRIERNDRTQERRQERRQERANEKNQQATDFLTELAEVTAGRMYESEVTDLRKTFRLIADELRHQYILGFYPDNSDFTESPHTIKVLVARKELVVRARRSYKLLTIGTE